MDYKKQYTKLVQRALTREIEENKYYERHHIVPRCWGGSNKSENLVHLTAREHYLAHWLLHRMRPHSQSAGFAFWKMTFPGSKFVEREYKISSRAYAEAKEALSESMKKRMTGYKVPAEHLVKWTKNKNNTKSVINVKTGEEFPNAKAAWKKYFKDEITYSSFNYYMRGKIKNNGLPAKRKVDADKLYEWVYKNDKT
jgi:leucyl aminopeptidase (aminopeptidase T)